MYAVKQDGAFAGYADSIVPIRLHGNGCYVPVSYTHLTLPTICSV